MWIGTRLRMWALRGVEGWSWGKEGECWSVLYAYLLTWSWRAMACTRLVLSTSSDCTVHPSILWLGGMVSPYYPVYPIYPISAVPNPNISPNMRVPHLIGAISHGNLNNPIFPPSKVPSKVEEGVQIAIAIADIHGSMCASLTHPSCLDGTIPPQGSPARCVG